MKSMKYVFLFCNSNQEQAQWESMPEDVRTQAYSRINEWFEANAAVFGPGHELQPPSTATTVRFNGNREPLVTDGPYIEGNEVIGGYTEVDVPDLDAALRIAKTWPGGSVEIRPVVAR
jgi:hypothetical protein